MKKDMKNLAGLPWKSFFQGFLFFHTVVMI